LPNPHLDLSYLKARNILLAGVLMIVFRFLLIRTGLLISVFLERLHQYRTTETGALFSLSVIPFLIALPASAWLMRRLRVRPVMVFG
ncbi:hypothetical protein, partial [Escherichia coli]|uniref:hypothetical protein n=1 Tax=Escherichia coli TaxID=562 RepID=UPI003CE5284A